MLVVCVSFVLLICVSLFLMSCSSQGQTIQQNKEIAAKVLHDLYEGKDLRPLVSQYFDPNIELEFPEAFAMPHHGDHHIRGVKELAHGVGAWQKETAHQVEIEKVLGEGDSVAILARMDRVFKMDGKEKVYKGTPFSYFFEFKDGKIIKATGIFDVLNDVEQYKAKKYKNHKGRQ